MPARPRPGALAAALLVAAAATAASASATPWGAAARTARAAGTTTPGDAWRAAVRSPRAVRWRAAAGRFAPSESPSARLLARCGDSAALRASLHCAWMCASVLPLLPLRALEPVPVWTRPFLTTGVLAAAVGGLESSAPAARRHFRLPSPVEPSFVSTAPSHAAGEHGAAERVDAGTLAMRGAVTLWRDVDARFPKAAKLVARAALVSAAAGLVWVIPDLPDI